MGLTYFKRFRMEIDLEGRDFSEAPLPDGYLVSAGTIRFWKPMPM